MNIIIVSAYFAPAFQPNAVRAVRLSSHLAKQGHDVTVVTLDERSLLSRGALDEDLARSLHSGVRVVRVSGGPSRRHPRPLRSETRFGLRLEEKLLVPLLFPDPYMDCLPGLLRTGRRLLKQHGPDLVISIAYPWTCHIVAGLLARSRNIRWIAEYGDPWADNPASDIKLPRWRKRTDKAIEGRLLRRVSRLVVTTERTKRHYLSLFPFLEDRIDVIRPGFREEPCQPGDAKRVSKLNIVYTGRIYPGARSLVPFIEALRHLRSNHPSLADTLHVALVGDVDLANQREIGRYALADVISIIGWQTQEQISHWRASADILLMLGNHGGIQVPSKLYEYLGSRKPILMIKEDESDEAAEIVENTDSGWIVNNRTSDIARFLDGAITGAMRPPSFRGSIPIERFSEGACLESYSDTIRKALGASI